eukprot:TRINITY_DN14551_c0_g1_i1.p2 TRINITY_DN14551_c0_g1~~TRINITY_DN14551_c0_g1_i1.p2  ORF type:complete len:128 (-),score=36.13 TRINITY_DN14551_c0_g1_i1:64-447(-)
MNSLAPVPTGLPAVVPAPPIAHASSVQSLSAEGPAAFAAGPRAFSGVAASLPAANSLRPAALAAARVGHAFPPAAAATTFSSAGFARQPETSSLLDMLAAQPKPSSPHEPAVDESFVDSLMQNLLLA